MVNCITSLDHYRLTTISRGEFCTSFMSVHFTNFLDKATSAAEVFTGKSTGGSILKNQLIFDGVTATCLVSSYL